LESFPNGLGSGQDKEGLRDESLVNDEVKQYMERGLEKAIVEQDKAQGNKVEIRTRA
jgi:hypothetical protein